MAQPASSVPRLPIMLMGRRLVIISPDEASMFLQKPISMPMNRMA
jgi:hypothetical protein